MDPDPQSPRLLAISAHPDDVEFTSGGSLARWTDEGWVIDLMVCTDGSKGSQDPGDDPGKLSALRRWEQEDAALSGREPLLRMPLMREGLSL